MGALMRMPFGESCQGFGPAQSGALAIVITWGLTPGGQQVDPLLGLAFLARLRRVHIDAVGAAVDLRSTDLDELGEARVEAGVDGRRGSEPAFHERRGRGEEIISSHD